jgi:Na+/H+ antiporter NhaD/arsenite permease-like protein
VVQVARAHGVTIRFWDYAKVGLAIYRTEEKIVRWT